MNGEGACIVQNDHTVLLDTGHNSFERARELLGNIAELVKTLPSFHTYRITPLSLWNAAALGWTSSKTLEELKKMSRFSLPARVEDNIQLWMSRYGQLILLSDSEDSERMVLQFKEEASHLLQEVLKIDALQSFDLEQVDSEYIRIKTMYRGLLKQELTKLGFPVLDKVGYRKGAPLPLDFISQHDKPFRLRDYQEECVSAFVSEHEGQGSGVLVLPCGAGKTIIGMGVMESLQCETLILTSNITSVRQWIQELLCKTSLQPEQIGEYSGERKEVRPVTVSTYQILTHRARKSEPFKHMQLLSERDWGLIVYDEVHLLPAPVFRATADIQATRRLGLTATLVREDGCEQDVFSLIGPKQKEVGWKELEYKGWIATVECCEVRVPMQREYQARYDQESMRGKFRISAENPVKTTVIKQLLSKHEGRQILIIGQYVEQLEKLSKELRVPLITGDTPQEQRNKLYAEFRQGIIRVLVVSKVANFAVNLPDASVAIQISGSFGSRQEEAQRLGRILRPKAGDNHAYFYTIVSENSREQEFAVRRQLFLIEQGYTYSIHSAESLESRDQESYITQKEA